MEEPQKDNELENSIANNVELTNEGKNSIIENVLTNNCFDDSGEDFETADFSIEEKNYSKLSYKKLQRLRIDGVAFGVKIPVLKYDLQKPEKKRKSFMVFAILSTIIFAIGLTTAVLLVAGLIPSFLESVGAVNQLNNNATANVLTLGLTSLFGGTMSIFIWLLAITALAILISLVCFLFYFVRTFFSLTRCSIQEMAIGYEVRNIISTSIILIILSGIITGILTYGFVVATQITTGVIILYLILVAILAYSISMLVVVLIEKKKAKELFNSLPEDLQENFKEHTNAISRVKERIKRIKNSDTNNFNFY